MTTGARPCPLGPRRHARKDSIGLPHVLFQSVTHMAPAVSLAFISSPRSRSPGRYYRSRCSSRSPRCCAWRQRSASSTKEIRSAGGLFTYTARGLGSKVGFLVGWAFLLIEPLVAPLLFLLFAFLMQDVFATEAGWDTGWVVWVFVAAGVMFLLAYRDVRLSTGLGMALGVFELLLLALAVWVIFSVDDHTLQVFNPDNATEGAASGTFKGVVFAITALVGLESAARSRRRPAGRDGPYPAHLFFACLSIGLLYVVFAYALVVGFGFDGFAETVLASANPVIDLAREYWGWGWWLVFAAIVNGVLANGNAALNTASRIQFAMSRAGVLPAPLSRRTGEVRHPSRVDRRPDCRRDRDRPAPRVEVGPSYRAEHPRHGDRILTDPRLHHGQRRGDRVLLARATRASFNWLLHGLVPAIGAIAFLSLSGTRTTRCPAYPLRWAVWLAPAWILVGVGDGAAWFSTRKPEALENTRRMYVEEDAAHPGELRTGVRPSEDGLTRPRRRWQIRSSVIRSTPSTRARSSARSGLVREAHGADGEPAIRLGTAARA